MTYISGFVQPVPNENKQAYIDSAKAAWPLFREYGAIQHVEGWGDNVPDGKQTDFKKAVAAKEGETVVFAWLLWPDKAASDRCDASMETDERWQQLDMPFDGKRMIYGGFETVFTEAA